MTVDQRAIHAGLSYILIGISFVLSLRGSTFGTSQTYTYMQGMASENTWALLFGLAGNAGLIGLVASWRWVQLGSVAVISSMHALFCIVIALGSPLSTGTAAYSGVAGLGYWLLYRRITA